jgi:hypothetical protein
VFLHFFAALAKSFAALAVKDLTFLQIATKNLNRKGRKGFRKVRKGDPRLRLSPCFPVRRFDASLL